MPTPQLIIFDCDGTLVNSEDLAHEALTSLLAEHGVHVAVEHTQHLLRGTLFEESVPALEAISGRALPDDFVPMLRSRIKTLSHEKLRPMDGALELVQSLPIPFCVASSARRESIELNLSLAGLLPFFSGRIFSSFELNTWKPEPGIFLHAARTMQAAPANCVVVEDSLNGIAAGIAAGMQVVALQPFGAPQPIPEGVRIIASLRELSFGGK